MRSPTRPTVAQKILSCVARVKQTWGIGHVTDVLIGKATRESRGRAATHELSTFGLLKEEPAAAVRGYVEQLVGDGLLAARRRSVSGAAADRRPARRCCAARATARSIARSQPPVGQARPRAARDGLADRRRLAISSTCCARCGCGWRASAACRRT